MMKSSLSLLHLVSLVGLVTSGLPLNSLSNRIIITNYGKLRGVKVEFDDPSLQTVEAYLGIQYASLHGGHLRFMPPTNPTERWDNVKFANTFGPVCPQKKLDFAELSTKMPACRVDRLRRISEFTQDQSEECLYLNIYIPARDRKGPAPVVLFIHGESYDYGTGNAYDGSVLSSFADIAVVTVNYRLGPLGFLSTSDGAASGNYALSDLVAAVHWIQNNIADFGGDRTQVTVMGHGYGAALANLLSLAPVTQRISQEGKMLLATKFGMNLFNRVILQSGSALSPWAMAADPVRSAKDLADSLNCLPVPEEGEPIDTKVMVNCLSEVGHEEMMNADVPYNRFVTTFGPVVDKILVELSPELMIKQGDTLFSNIELMFGVNKYEGVHLLSQDDLENGITPKRKLSILRQYVRSVYQYPRLNIFNTLDHQYFDWSDRNSTSKLKHKVIELLGDGMYNAPLVQTGRYHLDMGKDTYFYVFSHSNYTTNQAMGSPQYKGGYHGEDLTFLFGAPLSAGTTPFGDATFSRSEQVLSEAVMRFFGNFIISGNPNIPLNDGPPTYTSPNNLRFINVYWPKYETGSHKYIQLGTRPLVSHDYRQARVALWTDHISGLHQPGETGVNSSQDLLDIIDSSTAGVDVRHIFPQPPTPPVIPPYHEKTTITQATKTKTTKARILQSDVDVITQQPITEVITKVVEVIRYKNKTVYFTESNSAPSSADEGIQMTLTLALTVGIGSAFLFLNLIIIIGICCQRSRVRAELAAVKKVQQQTSLTNTPLLTTETEHSTKSMRKGDAVKMLESHLYEKAMQHIDKQASSDKIVRPNADRRIPSEVNILEEGQSKGICDTMSSSRTKINYDTDNDTTDNEIIRGVPQGPAKPPVNMEPDIYALEFDLCNRSISSQHLGEGSLRSSQYSLSSQRTRNRAERPIPRQRTSESLSQLSNQEAGRQVRTPRQQMSPRPRGSPQNEQHFRQPNSAHDSQFIRSLSPGEPVTHYNREMAHHNKGMSHQHREMSHANGPVHQQERQPHPYNGETHLHNSRVNPYQRHKSDGHQNYSNEHLNHYNGQQNHHSGHPNHYNGHHSPRSISENGQYTDRSLRRQASPRTAEEAHYQTPRRLKYHSEDGLSSDSGVQHMTYQN